MLHPTEVMTEFLKNLLELKEERDMDRVYFT